MPGPAVGVSIVTCNSARYIERCLDTIFSQTGAHLEIVVVDNASTDRTTQVVEKHGGRLRLIRNGRNVGFAAAQNQAIRCLKAPWILALNPDVLLNPGIIRELIEAGESDRLVGTVCGKLLSIGAGFTPLEEPRIDS